MTVDLSRRLGDRGERAGAMTEFSDPGRVHGYTYTCENRSVLNP